jgi:hypothetical protein
MDWTYDWATCEHGRHYSAGEDFPDMGRCEKYFFPNCWEENVKGHLDRLLNRNQFCIQRVLVLVTRQNFMWVI